MPRESAESRKRRSAQIFARLRETYPDAHCELKHRNPLELLVATMLSAQCSDRQVNLVTTELFKRFRSAADYANATPDEIAIHIRRLGLFRNKARNLKACCQKLVERHGGRVPETLDELTALDGVGRKTANVVLGNAFGINAGVVVDTHVARLTQRLALTSERTPEKIEQALMQLAPQAQWGLLSHWLIWHGRRRCFARKPDCAHCEVQALCPSAGKVE